MTSILEYANFEQIIKIARELQNPKALAAANENPINFFGQYGIILPTNAQYEIYLNNDNTQYIVVHDEYNTELSGHMMYEVLSAGSKARISSLSSLLSVSTIATGGITCASCFLSISSASTTDIDVSK